MWSQRVAQAGGQEVTWSRFSSSQFRDELLQSCGWSKGVWGGCAVTLWVHIWLFVLQGTKTKHERKEEKDRERREKKERRRERKEKKLRKLQLQKNVSSSTEESPKVGSFGSYFSLNSINDRIFHVDKKYLMITEFVWSTTHSTCVQSLFV